VVSRPPGHDQTRQTTRNSAGTVTSARCIMERQGAIALVLRRRDLCRQCKNDSGRTTARRRGLLALAVRQVGRRFFLRREARALSSLFSFRKAGGLVGTRSERLPRLKAVSS